MEMSELPSLPNNPRLLHFPSLHTLEHFLFKLCSQLQPSDLRDFTRPYGHTDTSRVTNRSTAQPRLLPHTNTMTRPKVDPDKRQRTANACDSCKRRKQKVCRFRCHYNPSSMVNGLQMTPTAIAMTVVHPALAPCTISLALIANTLPV